MQEFWTKEIVQDGKVIWTVNPDPEPEFFVVFRQGKFGCFATISGDFQGFSSGKCRPVGDPFGYDAAYVCNLRPCSYGKNASHGCYLALQRNGMWTMYVLDSGVAKQVIQDEPSLEAIGDILAERMWIRVGWTNLLEMARGPLKNPDHTPEHITKLEPHQVFVFGSNLEGKHIGGAARAAYEQFGAVWGQGVGLQGQSYAIPTMNLSLEEIRRYVQDFYSFADRHPEYDFLVTRIGCGIAGFKDRDIAPLFAEQRRNIILPESFADIIGKILRDEPY